MGFCFPCREERMKQMQVDRLEEGIAVLVDEEERLYHVREDFFRVRFACRRRSDGGDGGKQTLSRSFSGGGNGSAKDARKRADAKAEATFVTPKKKVLSAERESSAGKGYGYEDPKQSDYMGWATSGSRSLSFRPLQNRKFLRMLSRTAFACPPIRRASQGTAHKRVPDDIAENPVIVGHEFCGEILEVGEKWKHKY